MRYKSKNNLEKLVTRIRSAGLYLAVHLYENKYPQLIITTINPLKKSKTILADSLYVLSFVVPTCSSALVQNTEEIIRLKIKPYSDYYMGICDGLMVRIMSILDKKIEKLKEIQEQK